MDGLVNKLGVMSYVYQGFSARQMADAICSHGMKCVQVDPRQADMLKGDPFSERRAAEIRRIFEERGIEIVALSGYINILDPNPDKREANLRTLERMIELCEAYGTRWIATETGSFHPTNQWRHHPDNDTEYAWELLLTTVDRLRGKAVRHNAGLLLEGYVDNVLNSPERAEALIEKLGTEGLGLVLDPFNYMTEADLERQPGALDRIFRRIAGLCPIAHAKDAMYTDKGFKTPRAGTGRMDWKRVAAAMARYAPDIPLILEHLLPEEVGETLAFVKERFAEEPDGN